MKKLLIASTIAMMMTGSASVMASQGDVQFFGNVTSATCDVVPEVGGNLAHTVQLGTVAVNQEGKKIPLVFKAKDANGQDCSAMNGKTATIAWTGPLSDKGIDNQSGLATGAYVELTSKNAKENQQKTITKKDTSVAFEAEKVVSEGFAFEAQLKGGNTPGDFRSAAAYAVTYQ